MKRWLRQLFPKSYVSPPCDFPGSHPYWEQRYSSGGTSGTGSYGHLARFKADFLNGFVQENTIQTVIEFGCGDGNQLGLADYPVYRGLDVAQAAIQTCCQRFSGNIAKSFYLYDPLAFLDNSRLFVADLALSLDVIFHLVEDEVYHKYMQDLFNAATRFVIIYSSNCEAGGTAAHVRHRKFVDWTSLHAQTWQLKQKVDNEYPFDPDHPDETSFADFYIFEPRVA